MHRPLFSFLLSLSPAFLAALVVIGTMIDGNLLYNTKVLLWLSAAILLPVFFMVRIETELIKIKQSKVNQFILTIWLFYAVILLATIIYKMNANPGTLLYTLIWIVPFQILLMSYTWVIVKRDFPAGKIIGTEQQAQEIPSEIYLSEEGFKTYCREMLRSGDGFQILLAVKEGGDLPFLNDKTNSLVLLEGQWQNNEKDFKRLRITTEEYSTTKTRLMEAIADALEIT